MPEEFHSQDWPLIIETLTRDAGPEVETPRQCRAWDLAETIANREGLALPETPRQMAFTWPGPSARRDRTERD
jgi:hypothetical protein